MFRRHQDALVAFFILFIVGVGYFIIQRTDIDLQDRQPAAASDWTQSDFDHATLSVSMSEFQNSRPQVGRSYFDLIFSELNKTDSDHDADGVQVKYKVPYPFNQLLVKLEDYTGKKLNSADSSGPKVVIFPMGRSLQRNAAVAGLNQAFSFEPFFRYPRVVVGIDEEPTYENSMILNLKNKLYIGYNERAEILEAISYNDEEGRFEYQLVRDYANGKTPQVIYANRSLCLSCHQNQTPIFSRGPWSESNANPLMAERMKARMDADLGVQNCTTENLQPYCYRNNKPYYFGAPIYVDQSISYRLDTATDNANLLPVYQRMWKDLCTTQDCQLTILKSILLFRLNGQQGLINEPHLMQTLQSIENTWQQNYPNGMAIPSPNIPNRDPLTDISNSANSSSFSTVNAQNQKSVQDLLAQSKIPTEFEPLLPRQPLDIFKNSGLDVTNTNRLIKGLAQEFMLTDIKMIDQWLQKNKTSNQVVTELNADCQFDKDGTNLAISCQTNGAESFAFDTYINMSGTQGSANSTQGGRGDISSFSLQSNVLNCNSHADRTDANTFQGISCPEFQNLKVGYYKSDTNTALLFLQRQDGLSIRTIGGLYVAEVNLDLTTNKAKLKVYDQSKLVSEVLQANQNKLFSSSVFNRFQIMKTLTDYAQMQMNRVQNRMMTGLEMHIDGEGIASAVLQADMDGFTVMKNVCAKCHQNNEGVPPNFMGPQALPLNSYDQCRRIEQCAPRMMYRLKMRNCQQDDLQKKKNPMPPNFYLKNNNLTTDDWMKNHNPKVIQFLTSLVSEQELATDLTLNGLVLASTQDIAVDIMRSICPTANSVIYDQLPKCEFNNLKPMTRCR